MNSNSALIVGAIRLATEANGDIKDIRDTAARVAEHQENSLDHATTTCEALQSVAGNFGGMLGSIRDISAAVSEPSIISSF